MPASQAKPRRSLNPPRLTKAGRRAPAMSRRSGVIPSSGAGPAPTSSAISSLMAQRRLCAEECNSRTLKSRRRRRCASRILDFAFLSRFLRQATTNDPPSSRSLERSRKARRLQIDLLPSSSRATATRSESATAATPRPFVMAGLDPAIQAARLGISAAAIARAGPSAWMAGSSPRLSGSCRAPV